MSDYSGFPFFSGKGEYGISGSPELKGSDFLEVFAFEKELTAENCIQLMRGKNRCPVDKRAYSFVCSLNISKSREFHSLMDFGQNYKKNPPPVIPEGGMNISYYQLLYQPKMLHATVSPARTTETIDISLIRMLRAGPEVSLNGSPTVSPTTDAL